MTEREREDAWPLQSQTSTKAFLVALKTCLQLHLWLDMELAVQTGAWRLTMKVLLAQHEHCWKVLLADLARMHEQSEAFYLRVGKL